MICRVFKTCMSNEKLLRHAVHLLINAVEMT